MQNKKILILCTGNSCRSQMAEGILKFLDPELKVYSAGTNIAKEVHPKAIQVLKEIGIDISSHYPKKVDIFLKENFDYVITVCDSAKETCPNFTGNVKHKIHLGFEDPAKKTGTEEEILKEFRKIRDEIYTTFKNFYENNLKQ